MKKVNRFLTKRYHKTNVTLLQKSTLLKVKKPFIEETLFPFPVYSVHGSNIHVVYIKGETYTFPGKEAHFTFLRRMHKYSHVSVHYINFEDDERNNPTPYEDYPNPDASGVSLYLTAGNPERGGLGTTQLPGQGKETLVDNFSFSGGILAKAEYTDHRLLFVSPVLSGAVHISGTARITIKLACNKTAANLSVWLVSLPWTEGRNTKITDNLITRGWADPQNYRSLSSSKPLKPGKFYKMSFDLQPDDQIIPPGQQIGLMIFSSDRDFTLWPEPGTELTIDLDATSITIPVVGGIEAYKNAVEE
jgi:X-Pro dipeptidyl-peptidase